MAYTSAEGRTQILDELAVATDHLGLALAALGEAYELLDERTGDRLEEQLFGPVQKAYGRAKRTHSEFATRYDLPTVTFQPQLPGLVVSAGIKAFVERALASAGQASHELAALQDSMLPVEVGDTELRNALSEIRRTIDPLAGRGRELLRMFGR